MKQEKLPTFITLPEAAKRTGLPLRQLRQLINNDTLEAVKITDEIVVNEKQLDHLKTKKDFNHLSGKGITLTDAAKKYDVPRGAMKNWVYRHHYIKIIDRSGYPLKVDEADAAYCASVYKARKENGIRSGVPLLDEAGLPYDRLKHPQLSERRRQRKQI